jgi:protein SCO1/2
MNKSFKRLAFILVPVPVALVLGIVMANWVRQAQWLPKTDDALLASGMKIDASLAALSDSKGQPMSESRLKGRYRLVSFGFTSCPDVCPTMLLGVRQALEKLGDDAKDLTPIFVSVDPERDTPERIGTYVAAFDPRIVGLTGSPEALQQLARNYRMIYAKRPLGEGRENYTIDHTALIYLIDPQQRIRALVPAGAGPEAVAADIVEAYRAVHS